MTAGGETAGDLAESVGPGEEVGEGEFAGGVEGVVAGKGDDAFEGVFGFFGEAGRGGVELGDEVVGDAAEPATRVALSGDGVGAAVEDLDEAGGPRRMEGSLGAVAGSKDGGAPGRGGPVLPEGLVEEVGPERRLVMLVFDGGGAGDDGGQVAGVEGSVVEELGEPLGLSWRRNPAA
ncbi:MAG TPA: hypothetical protein VI854_02925 [Acidimicrobiia bacterium]|nr:hypothetical protein [Acidimicrobiia bacterium]